MASKWTRPPRPFHHAFVSEAGISSAEAPPSDQSQRGFSSSRANSTWCRGGKSHDTRQESAIARRVRQTRVCTRACVCVRALRCFLYRGNRLWKFVQHVMENGGREPGFLKALVSCCKSGTGAAERTIKEFQTIKN